MATVYIGLGSNLRDRLAFLNRAVGEMDKLQNTEVSILSSIYETDPVGGPLQGRYLNAVCAITTSLSPTALLNATKKIEYDLGRRRKGHWEARFIDIDILVFPGVVMQTTTLTLPHPLLDKRWFVLVPLVEIAPDLVPPGYSRNVTALLHDLGPPEGIDRYEGEKPWGNYSHLMVGNNQNP